MNVNERMLAMLYLARNMKFDEFEEKFFGIFTMLTEEDKSDAVYTSSNGFQIDIEVSKVYKLKQIMIIDALCADGLMLYYKIENKLFVEEEYGCISGIFDIMEWVNGE